MDKIKELCRELADKYREQKLELGIMLLFLLLTAVMGGSELAKEASSSRVSVSPGAEDGRETEDETAESGNETEEGASESGSGTENETAESESGTETETEEPGPETERTEEELLEEMRREDRRRLSELGREFVIPMAAPEDYEPLDFEASLAEAENDVRFHTFLDTLRLYRYELLLPEGENEQLPRASLESEIGNMIAEYDGDWSVYMKNLSTGEDFVINDRPMKSASVMKLFIMGTVYEAFETGELERTEETMRLLNDMIVYSDNEASNQLLYRLGESDYGRGIARVNEYIDSYDFSDMTMEYNGFNDPATNMGTGHFNQVSAKDCGRLLEAVYRREWVSRSVSNEIEQMMLGQNTRYKIPAGLPEGVACGNKSGEMDTTENDAAVVYSAAGDYILVVLSSDWNSKDEAVSRIRAISARVYEYLNETEDTEE